MPLSKPVRRIAIVGTGVIGASWAAFYLARGFDVIATDPAPNAEANLRHFVDTAWPALATLGVSPKASPEHLWFTADVRQASADADFVQENAPEAIELKVKLFAEMDNAAPPDSIIASSSSGLSMTIIQSACRHSERCVIGHPLNPPHIIPLVEVVGGAKTSPETVQQAISFYSSIGKKPIHVRKEVAGHVANRLQAALYREVANLIDQEVLDVASADAAVCWGPGLRWGVMGPNLLFHLGGGADGIHHFMEHLAGPMTTWWKNLGNPELTPKLKQTIIDGALQEAGNRSVAQLARQRDEALLGLIRLRRKFAEAPHAPARTVQSRKKT
ncbi:MAG TPA: 3-hydroxyacyl-CoA dehydrogenase NAD-binding domain-containing protein [Casimicrobiaceae bacterium]|jgi:carnitine 3-dehydrogenase|nr:3-hydroxyacyl-CoA dehydrogenase NAD-binding domain-containing protein [Casimicrobiaceae bacterium]